MFLQFLPKYVKFIAAAVGEAGELHSWRLQTLAVDPDYQRKGVGTLLVNTIAPKAALTKTPLCVDCSEVTNVISILAYYSSVERLSS